jgi:hypothetical protein
MVEMKHKELVVKGFYAPEHGRHFHCAPNKTVDIPEDVVWRAKAHGFHKAREFTKPVEIEVETIVSKPSPKRKRKR